MIIKKFKNGNINLKLQKEDIEDGQIDENVYHDEMFMDDLYIHIDYNGDKWIADYNTGRAYYLGSYLLQNPLKSLLDTLYDFHKDNKVYKLEPITDEEALKEIFTLDLDNEE